MSDSSRERAEIIRNKLRDPTWRPDRAHAEALATLLVSYGALWDGYEIVRAGEDDYKEEIAERANAQSHAEELLHQVSAFLTGWTFANLDQECAAEAEQLDTEISALFAYGWPRAQHPAGPSSASAQPEPKGGET